MWTSLARLVMALCTTRSTRSMIGAESPLIRATLGDPSYAESWRMLGAVRDHAAGPTSLTRVVFVVWGRPAYETFAAIVVQASDHP